MIRDLRRHGERAGADILDELVILVHREGLEAPGSLGRRQTHIVARLQVQGFHLAADVRPSAVKELAQRGHSRFLQTLHGGGHERIVAVLSDSLFANVVLVNVNADHIRLALQRRFHRGGVDAAAAGEDDLGAGGVPAFHLGGDVGVAEELAAIGVVDLDRGAQLNSRRVRALHEAVAVALHGRNRHAAEEAQLGVAVLHDRVAGQVARLLLAEHGAVQVLLRIHAAQIAGGNVNRDEVHIRVQLLRLRDSLAEQIARADDDLRALGHGQVDGIQTLVGAVSARLIVLIGLAVGLGIGFNALPAGLVEGFVVDGANVGHERNLGGQRGGGGHRKQRGQNEQYGKDLFHDTFLLSCWLAFPNRGDALCQE